MFRFWQNLWGPRPVPDAGRRGEELAADWLATQRKFALVARNWRSPSDRRLEIDLVGRDGDVLVFVEVKARAEGALVPGIHAVDSRKKRVLRRSIQAYLSRLRLKPHSFRFDIVEVILPLPGSPETPKVLHFENVALFSKHFR